MYFLTRIITSFIFLLPLMLPALLSAQTDTTPQNDNPDTTWSIPLKTDVPVVEEKKDPVIENFQINTTEDQSIYPLIFVSGFYTPGAGAFRQKFYGNDTLNFQTSTGKSYRGVFEYQFTKNYSVGGMLGTSSFITKDQKVDAITTFKGSTKPMLAMGAFMRYRTHINTIQKKLAFDFFFSKETLPMIDYSAEKDTELQVYTFNPSFWNLSASYQSPLNSLFNMYAFAQYGSPIDSPSANGLKLTKAHHIAFGAEINTDVFQDWLVHMGFENTSFLTEAKFDSATNQVLMTSLIFRLGLTYQLPQFAPNTPTDPEKKSGDYLPGI